MDARMDGCKVAWISGWMDGLMDGCMDTTFTTTTTTTTLIILYPILLNYPIYTIPLLITATVVPSASPIPDPTTIIFCE